MKKKKLPGLLKWTEPKAVYFHYRPQLAEENGQTRKYMNIMAVIFLFGSLFVFGWKNWEPYVVFAGLVLAIQIYDLISRINPHPCSIASDGIRRFGLDKSTHVIDFWHWDVICQIRIKTITTPKGDYGVLEVLDQNGLVLDQFGLSKRFNHDLFNRWIDHTEKPLERVKNSDLV